MVCGGSEAALTPLGISGFAAMRALSERNDDPAARQPALRRRARRLRAERRGRRRGARRTRPRQGPRRTDLRRDVRLRRQRRRQPHHPAGPGRRGRGPSHGAGPARRRRQSRRRSDTSTPTGPARCWATRRKRPPSRRSSANRPASVTISSTKSQLGHLLGASGGVELIVAVSCPDAQG